MTSLQHHIVTQHHSSSSHMDNHLDALLDDLQTSVSRPGTIPTFSNQNGPLPNGSNFGGHINLPPGATGYREITTMVTRDTNGMPTTSRDYQIEYLKPANSVTVLDERSSSPAIELLKGGDLGGHQVQSYKTEVYDYKFSKTTSDNKNSGFGVNQIGVNDAKNLEIESKYQGDPNVQSGSQFSRTERSERTENFQERTSAQKNLNELDMLLKELNTAAPQEDSKDSFSREYYQTFESKNDKSSGRYLESPSSLPKRSASATRDLTYSERTQNYSNRAQSPTVLSSTPKASTRTITVQREESRSHTSRRDSPSARNRSAEMSPILRRRTPSPSSGEFRPANFNNYPISPKDLTPTRTVTSKSYGFSSTGRSPTPVSFDEPQPYRSPSPVSFPQKRSPSPIRRNLNRSDSGRSNYQVRGGGDHSQGASEYTHKIEYAREYKEMPDRDLQRSPSFERNLRPSNVKITQSYAQQQQQQQQQSEEYHNQYHQNEKPGSFRKEYQRREEFHTREQRSGHYQQPPQPQQQREHYQQSQYQQYQQSQGKYQQEDRDQYQQNQGGVQREHREFSQQGQGSYHHDQKYEYETNKQYRHHSNQIPVNESMTSQAYRSATCSKSVAGPPVYYPPGVELFTKKEEAMLKQEQSGKKGKSKSKGNKNKDKMGMKTYPACFPICCAMPCSIM